MREPSAPFKMFVYGTLMKGFRNYDISIKGHEVSMVPARTRGKLWHLCDGDYPAMKEGGGWVYGELVEVDDFSKMIDIIDDIEDYFGPGDPNNEYDRILVPVEITNTGELELAYAYFYRPDNIGSEENPAIALPEGSWKAFKAQE